MKNFPQEHSYYIETLISAASTISSPIRGKFRVSACIVYKGKVVSVGISRKKSHPFQALYAKNIHAIYMHAEVAAIRSALKIISLKDLSKSTLYVCRIKRERAGASNFVLGMSKPCDGCLRCIHEFGIEKVYYTTDDGEISKL